MISAGLVGQVAGWAADAATQPTCLRQLFVLERRGADWKIAYYMCQLMPEQSGGGCSGI